MTKTEIQPPEPARSVAQARPNDRNAQTTSAPAVSPPAVSYPAVSPPAVDFVIPVYNEQLDLERSVLRLHKTLRETFPYSFRITIADNASTDLTWDIAQRLALNLPQVTAVHLTAKGRGRALRHVWSHSDAAVLAYMDADLSTDLAAVLPLVAPLISGHSDLAIGTRLARDSHVIRGPKREFISRTYNLIVQTALGASFSDAQCGFKAIRADAAARLLPLVEDPEWFFDTELLVLAERAGMRIHEVPVDWTDAPGTTVDIRKTASKDLAGILRLVRGLSSRRIPLATLADPRRAEAVTDAPRGMFTQLGRFLIVGVASTIAYAALFLALREVASAQWSNSLALFLTAIANTAANRWFTFGVRGRVGRVRHQIQGMAVFALGLGITSGSLLALNVWAPQASRVVELIVLTLANVVATLVRFLLYRAWIFALCASRTSDNRSSSNAQSNIPGLSATIRQGA